jgi:hypothetical protein
MCWGFDVINDRVIATGEYRNTVDFDPSPAVFIIYKCRRESDIYHFSAMIPQGNFIMCIKYWEDLKMKEDFLF